MFTSEIMIRRSANLLAVAQSVLGDGVTDAFIGTWCCSEKEMADAEHRLGESALIEWSPSLLKMNPIDFVLKQDGVMVYYAPSSCPLVQKIGTEFYLRVQSEDDIVALAKCYSDCGWITVEKDASEPAHCTCWNPILASTQTEWMTRDEARKFVASGQ